MRRISTTLDKKVDVEILSFSNNNVDARIGGGDNKVWRFTGFYGNPEVNHKDKS